MLLVGRLRQRDEKILTGTLRAIYMDMLFLRITLTDHTDSEYPYTIYSCMCLLIAVRVSLVTCILATSPPSLHGVQQQQGCVRYPQCSRDIKLSLSGLSEKWCLSIMLPTVYLFLQWSWNAVLVWLQSICRDPCCRLA